jgi:hypothetical protein
MAIAVIAVVVGVIACHRAPIASCADDLGGVWASETATWSILDTGTTVEIDPLFADAPVPRDVGSATVYAAPRVIDLRRMGDGLSGALHQMYTQQADHCIATVPVRITSCHDDGIEIVLADPSPPLAFPTCVWPRPASSRVERWHRR